MRILLIEDEPLLGDAVRERIVRDGHAVDWMQRLDDARAALAAVDYQLVLLDLHLPDGRGLDLLKEMRRKGDKRPVMILTARDQIRDRIDGLHAGADDYMVKPFDLDELAARIGAVARRYAGNPNPAIHVKDIEIDLAQRSVRHSNGRSIDVTGREWVIIEALASRHGRILTKAQLEEAIYDFGVEIESNAIEVYVSRLRKKLGPGVIVTLRGIGYRLGGESQ
jgi:two-component system OmpR family response regulator